MALGYTTPLVIPPFITRSQNSRPRSTGAGVGVMAQPPPIEGAKRKAISQDGVSWRHRRTSKSAAGERPGGASVPSGRSCRRLPVPRRRDDEHVEDPAGFTWRVGHDGSSSTSSRHRDRASFTLMPSVSRTGLSATTGSGARRAEPHGAMRRWVATTSPDRIGSSTRSGGPRGRWRWRKRRFCPAPGREAREALGAPPRDCRGAGCRAWRGLGARASTWRRRRPVRARPGAGTWRLRRGLGGEGQGAGAVRGLQGRAGGRSDERPRGAVAPRGGGRSAALAPEHRHALRRGAQRAGALPRPGAARRADARRAGGARCPPAAGGAEDRGRGRQGHRSRPRARRRPPRPHARERLPMRRRAGEGAGLRDGPCLRPAQGGRRNASLHGPGAGARSAGGRAHRRLRLRGDPPPDALGRASRCDEQGARTVAIVRPGSRSPARRPWASSWPGCWSGIP